MNKDELIPEIKTRQVAIGILIVVLSAAIILLLAIKKSYFHDKNVVMNGNNQAISTKPKVIKIKNSAQNDEQNQHMTDFSFTLPKR